MNYPVLKISVLAQTASAAVHAAVIAGGGWFFMHQAQFGMSAGQGGAVGLASRQVLQAEVQIADGHDRTETTTAQQEVADDLSAIPDPDMEMALTTDGAVLPKLGLDNGVVTSPTKSRGGEPLPLSVGSPGTLTATFPASGNGGARTVAQPVYLSNPPPAYPLTARQKGLEGRVVLRVKVGDSGAVEKISVKQGSGHEVLDQAALSAVKKWKFQPATIGGLKVADTIDLPVVFSLKK